MCVFSLAAAVHLIPIVLLDKFITDTGFSLFQYAVDACETSDVIIKAVRLL